ncbi:hypothetical protein Hypma_001652 [Hypsizygus marmoreus]|uniref:Fungal-type protein kinase domain-containing protein n=1 Tax=Hypsizygus marmoreus TaxID=39966 RepID=A0A369J7I2_HYPMA|nr:hypothetical protein Hypma_001652 [Hypsizygus marmoreus]
MRLTDFLPLKSVCFPLSTCPEKSNRFNRPTPASETFSHALSQCMLLTANVDMTMTWTPNKRCSAVVKQALHHLKSHTEDDIRGILFPGAPVKAFMEHDWGVQPHEIQTILASQWELPPETAPTGFKLEDRQLHAIAGASYKKLWEADNVAKFERVFVDCVECHYHAFNNGKVLHRDLGENDLMFKRKEGEVIGILNDWDMAPVLDSANQHAIFSLMSHRLICTRHDLESFYYILVCVSIHYDFQAKKNLDTHRVIEDQASLAGKAKQAFISDRTSSEIVYIVVPLAFHDLRNRWIRPLLMLFRTAWRSIDDEADQVAGYDTTTCGGHLTFFTLMRALNREPRNLA